MRTSKDVTYLLNRLGLKNRESRVYLTCLQFREGMFIHELVKQTRISRSTVDLIVKRLVGQGFLNRVKSGRRYRFFAQPPEAILFRQKELAADLEKVLPLLHKVGGKEKKENEVLFFEGTQGFKLVNDLTLLNLKFAKGEKKDILAFSSGADFVRLYPDFQKSFIDKRIKNGSWYKAIATHDSMKVKEWHSDPKSLRVIKYFPDNAAPLRIEMQIYADDVMIYSTVKPIGGVIIRNEKIAEAMRTIFKQIWNSLPD